MWKFAPARSGIGLAKSSPRRFPVPAARCRTAPHPKRPWHPLNNDLFALSIHRSPCSPDKILQPSRAKRRAAARTSYREPRHRAREASKIARKPSNWPLRFSAGHHNVFQHAHFQFAIENVSRQFYGRSCTRTPFYNSETVSQRYVACAQRVAMPRLPAPARAVYERCVRRSSTTTKSLRRTGAVVAKPIRAVLRSPSQEKRTPIYREMAQEVARYVLPVATHAYLVHTVWPDRAALLPPFGQMDAPAESEMWRRR
jgi:hypothetical protein